LSADLIVSERARATLRCPSCRAEIAGDSALTCIGCQAVYPIVQRIPILVDEATSLFSHQAFVRALPTTWTPTSKVRRTVSRFLPSLSKNMKAVENYRLLGDLLDADRRGAASVVVVVGGSRLGQGIHEIVRRPGLDFVDTDVSFGPRTKIVCDAHNLPFADGSVDAVVIQAVIQALLDPTRCIAEIHRVLREDGLIYAETPFMQQVCGAQYDFTRFTHLGHRRLFRDFEEIRSGAVCGPGMAFAWSYQYLLLSHTRRPALRTAIKGFTRATAFWLKYLDHYLIDKPGALDAASGFYFLGRRANSPLSDGDLVASYRGANDL
jgi:SAM-dependent methyltransferase/uncharacterized protein YbaR (Trm112 family)